MTVVLGVWLKPKIPPTSRDNFKQNYAHISWKILLNKQEGGWRREEEQEEAAIAVVERKRNKRNYRKDK